MTNIFIILFALTASSIYVVDGDTIRLDDGERIRVLGIDAPEAGHRARCERERLLAIEATEALRLLLAEAGQVGTVEIERRGTDVYDRTLAYVRVGGRDVGEVLMEMGLAQEWRGRRAEWCN